jgi:hypothetical protein
LASIGRFNSFVKAAKVDTAKVLKWIANIENFDGDALSLGSLRTLGDIKKEVAALENKEQPANSVGVAGEQGTANSAMVPLADVLEVLHNNLSSGCINGFWPEIKRRANRHQ